VSTRESQATSTASACTLAFRHGRLAASSTRSSELPPRVRRSEQYKLPASATAIAMSERKVAAAD